MRFEQSRWKKLGIGLSVTATLLGAGIFYYLSVSRGPIYDFDYARDSQEILNIFERDWYWLVASSREHYSPEFTLKYRTPKRNPLYFGRLRIKVLREGGAFVGFVAYFMETPNLGDLRFLAVNSEFRGKGYGAKLTRYALNDLICMGAKRIQLVTRTNNIPSQKLYKRLGFYETSRDDEGFVYFEYTP